MWAAYGERVALRLRQMLYDSVSAKSLAWFDTGMGVDKEADESGDGLGVLTARFSREIDHSVDFPGSVVLPRVLELKGAKKETLMTVCLLRITRYSTGRTSATPLTTTYRLTLC